MGEPVKKALAPVEPGWTLAFNLVRTEGDGAGETALSWRQRLTPLDLLLAAVGFLLFVVEPVAVTLALKHGKVALLAEQCAPTSQVVVLHAASGGPPEHAGGSAPGYEEGGQGDVITPLNVRDPSNLVMTPYHATDRARIAAERDNAWREALREAAALEVKKARPPKETK
ncbi:hypothetical protein EPO15_03695 [bacterium]|nr:MAG: hypothetical protein EPO15_03695 [bacterium]